MHPGRKRTGRNPPKAAARRNLRSAPTEAARDHEAGELLWQPVKTSVQSY